MIDIIIPCYNAHSTLDKTLQSIAIQSIKDKVNVLLVDDCSDNNYNDFVNQYKKYYNISEIRLNKNSGPGVAREKGIQKTKSKYIVFIDGDDTFYSYNSLELLFNKIEEGYDTINSYEFDQKRNCKILLNGNVHGKMYKRKYLIDNDIHFNNTRYHEDNYFNNLVNLTGAKKTTLDDCTYFYSFNKESITNNNYNDFDKLELYLKNMYELLNNAKKNNYNKERIIRFIVEKYRYLKRIYKTFSDEQKDTLKKWLKIYDPNFLEFIDLSDLEFNEKLLFYVLDYITE